MPAKRSSRKSRPARPAPQVADLTPANLDQVVVAPAVALPAVRPAAPKAGPPVTGAPGVGRGQQAGSARRYAFRRS
ncbi:hypothetical protein SAMN05443287_109190 [Micromonospora phaseoli]|uniref:Uncharacterized protein n=1 Tax=Micromonospora phaseoli TaxID=1144548 RepID=A0A1H7CGC8_9ACTN|nr:hypothetical protein [Micromonospora phaseoli]PZV97802.1 hypothetical protein CLV64_10564 [Micromonospora phaseoli]GIJ78462.1 hypothetical protein Xph01_28940 [Micromonospora phaseoli]SEJ88843.1 hypothetical protein SAMN05443287_109190 [Micromonospora phaseoli]